MVFFEKSSPITDSFCINPCLQLRSVLVTRAVKQARSSASSFEKDLNLSPWQYGHNATARSHPYAYYLNYLRSTSFVPVEHLADNIQTVISHSWPACHQFIPFSERSLLMRRHRSIVLVFADGLRAPIHQASFFKGCKYATPTVSRKHQQ